MVACREARRDLRLCARLSSSRALYYRDGADPTLDRPAHVRAASGICRFGPDLAIVQDDAAFVALVHDDGSVGSITLPAGPGGARQFDDERGNKADKPDLESCFSWPTARGDVLVGLGSGSTRARERAALVEASDPLASARFADGSAFYAALHALEEFSGSELNLEGAALSRDGRLTLLQRGNGAVRGARVPVDATLHTSGAALVRYFAGGAAVPALGDVVQWQLGEIDGVRLTFTDVTALDGRSFFLACAEDSPDVVLDGPVAGAAVGVFDDDGGARWAPLEGRAAVKAEGILLTSAGAGFVVLDPDDPHAPGELCTLELSGPWL